jgi:hypothetical protein
MTPERECVHSLFAGPSGALYCVHCGGDFYEANSTVDKRKRRIANLGCSYCPPNKGENAKRKAKHGSKKPKGKR